MRPLQVLYLLNSSQIGGGNRSMLTLWAFIQAMDVGVVAVAPRMGPMTTACAEASISVSIVPDLEPSWRHPVQLAEEFRMWSSTIARAKPSLIHTSGFVPSRCVALAASARRLPHICHVRFGEPPTYLKWVFRGLPKPDVFIMSSRALLDQVRPELARACPHAAFEVVHNAVDLAAFRPVARAPGPPRIGIVANLLPVKGHEDFLRMAQILLQRGSDAEFWIIGGDIHSTGYDADLRRRAADLGVSHRTTFFGHQADVPSLMAQLDVLVCASYEEPFGRALIEATYKEADVRGCTRTYWATQEFNYRARALYDQLATKSVFVQYRR